MRVGIDLVWVGAVRNAIEQHGQRYLERVYTDAELVACRSEQGVVPEQLAARFAAKEATLKVLRPDAEAVPLHTIEVVRNAAGWVEIGLSGPAAALARASQLQSFALSISHELDYATAVVVAEGGDDGSRARA